MDRASSSSESGVKPSDVKERSWAARLLPMAGLVLILALAAGLRFTGLSWELRHPVHQDERDYVDNVVSMVEAGDLDHRFYRYPGLFFYLLAPGVWLLGPERWGGPDAYLVSRGFVAGFGTLNVLLLYLVGARLIGKSAGLFAALLLAVSPVAVGACHQVRPDVLLLGFGLLGLLTWAALGKRVGADARAGVVIGLATAVKFTGLLMVPAYVAARILRPGHRLRGMVLAGALTIGLTVACTPFALIHASDYGSGPDYQLRMYFAG